MEFTQSFLLRLHVSAIKDYHLFMRETERKREQVIGRERERQREREEALGIVVFWLGNL
jgi:hypothetical protein